jgi:hypothetical protein
MSSKRILLALALAACALGGGATASPAPTAKTQPLCLVRNAFGLNSEAQTVFDALATRNAGALDEIAKRENYDTLTLSVIYYGHMAVSKDPINGLSKYQDDGVKITLNAWRGSTWKQLGSESLDLHALVGAEKGYAIVRERELNAAHIEALGERLLFSDHVFATEMWVFVANQVTRDMTTVPTQEQPDQVATIRRVQRNELTMNGLKLSDSSFNVDHDEAVLPELNAYWHVLAPITAADVATLGPQSLALIRNVLGDDSTKC